MTTEQALEEIEKHVQWCREEGETDLRGILWTIKTLREISGEFGGRKISKSP